MRVEDREADGARLELLRTSMCSNGRNLGGDDVNMGQRPKRDGKIPCTYDHVHPWMASSARQAETWNCMFETMCMYTWRIRGIVFIKETLVSYLDRRKAQVGRLAPPTKGI